MTKVTQRKYRISRAIGQSLWGDAKDPVHTRNFTPGQHGKMVSDQGSDYKKQKKAYMTLRGFYGGTRITERQFRKYFKEADRRKGDTSENLIGLLESRLDAIVYRSNFASTIFAARQLVSHGHIRVNGKKVNIPSYSVKEGDVISIKDSSKQLTVIQASSQANVRSVPEYISLDAHKFEATFVRVPKLSDTPYPVQMEPHLIVELYSR